MLKTRREFWCDIAACRAEAQRSPDWDAGEPVTQQLEIGGVIERGLRVFIEEHTAAHAIYDWSFWWVETNCAFYDFATDIGYRCFRVNLKTGNVYRRKSGEQYLDNDDYLRRDWDTYYVGAEPQPAAKHNWKEEGF